MKRQGNVVSSLMQNFDIARDALETSLNSSGSAMQEHAKWSESLEARLNKLKSTWQSLSQSFMSSDFLKSALDGVIGLVDGLDKLIDTFGVLPALVGGFAGGMSLFKNKGLLTFDKDINSIKLLGNSFTDLGNKYASVSTKIAEYNSLNTNHQKQFCISMQNSNTAFGKYISGLNGGTATMGGYIKSLVGAKVKTVALQVATTALNTALTMGISFAIQLVVEGIMKLINAESDLAEKVSELTSKFKEQHDELKKLEGDYDTANESSMISKYEKLSNGVDNLGRNVSLTADEYSEYQSVVNKIAEQIPSLISGYDSQGNALLSCKGNVEELRKEYEKLIHIQNQEILTSAGDIEESFANLIEKQSGEKILSNGHGFWAGVMNPLGLQNYFGDYELKADTVKNIERLLNATNEEDIKDIYNKLSVDDFSVPEIRTALEKANIEIGAFESPLDVLEETLETDPQKIKNIVDNYYTQFAEEIEKQKTIATAKLSEAFDISSAISGLNYGNISEDLQAIAHQTVNSLDWDFFTELSKSGKTVEQWTTEMLDQLSAIGKEDNTKIEAAFDLQTQFNGGDIPYGEYIKGLENTGKLIDGLDLKDEIKTQLKLSLGLDEDGLIEGYKVLKNKLANSEKFDIMPSEYKSFLDGLSSEEVSVLVDIIPELEKTDYKETIADVKTALEKEMMLQGLTFDLNLEVEAAGLEALNTALAESVSATGLSSESINALKGRYADLELQGYDLSSMFEETSTGIRLNRQEFDKLEKAYATEKLAEVDGDLTEMKSAYDDLGEAIKNCDDPIRKSELFNERQTLAKRISEAATLAHQYKGLTNAYNDWLSAEESGQERDMYENIIKGFETVDDEISRGWIDDGAIEFLELLTGRTDLAGKSGKQLKEIYDGLDESIKYLNKDGKVLEDTGYSVRDFFTVDEDGNSTNTGVYNFLDAIGKLEEEAFGGKNVVKRKGKDIIGFDFELAGGDEVIAEALGVSEELVQIMVRAADDAGFVVSMDGTYRQLADLQNEAKAAADYLHEIGKTDFEFDFNTTSVENLKTQLEEAHKILDDKKFWNKDGTFNFNADGATQAMQIVSTLQAKLDNLTSEKYGIGLTVEDEEFEEPLENLQDYGHKIATLNQLELNPKANAEEIKEINGELNEIAEYFANLDEDKKIELGFEADDGIEEVKKKIEDGEVKIPTVLDIQANMDKNIETLADLALLNSGLLSEDQEETIKKKYNVEVEADEVDTTALDGAVAGAFKITKGERKANIQIIAETFGVDDVDDLTSKLKGLDDKTVQAIAEVVGRTDVDALKQEIAKLEPTKVEAIVEAIGKGDVEGLKTAINNLEPKQVDAIAKALGYDDVSQLNTAVENMDGNTVQAVAQALGITDVQSLQTVIDNMQGNTVDAKVNTDGQASKIYTLQDVIDNLKGRTVDVVINTFKNIIETVSSGGKKKAAQRTGANPDGKGGVNGTANADGTTGRAFKQGSWGTKDSGTALVGELGAETLVRDGRYYTIGENNAEFVKYRKGDIIFNHKQTEELFRYGKVTSGGGRGKAFASGTAFSGGSGGGLGVTVKETTKIKETTKTTTTSTGSSGSGGGIGKVSGKSVGSDSKSKSSSSSSSSSTKEVKDDFEETFDWIEVAISRIERAIDNLDKKANNVYKTWSSRNKALTSEISKVGDEIKLQQQGYDRYIKEANSVGLSSSWAKKVREGKVDIQTIKDEALAEKIKDYQNWYEKALACKDAIEELKETEGKLYAQRFQNIQTQYDGILQGYEHTETMLNEYISQAEEQGHIVSKKYYQALIKNEKQNISQLKKEQSALVKARDEAVDSGKIAKNSEEWYLIMPIYLAINM